MGKAVDTIIENLGFKVRRIYLSSQIKTSIQGETFTLDISRKDMLRLFLPLKTSIGFKIAEKKGFKSTEESDFLDLTEEVKTGEAEFDRKFLVKSNFKREATLLFENRDLRNIIRALFNGWVKKLELDGKHLIATISAHSDSDTSLIKNIPQVMVELKGLLFKQSFLAAGERVGTSTGYWMIYGIPILMAIIQVVMAILLPAWMKTDFDPLDSGQLIFKTLLIFVPVTCLYLFFAFRVIKNHPFFLKAFSVCIFFAIVWLFSGFPFIQGLNGYFDRSSAVKSEFVVVDKVKARKSQTYILILRERKREGARKSVLTEKFLRTVSPFEVRITVKREEYLRAKPYETSALLYIRDGALGIRWIENYVLSEITKVSRCYNFLIRGLV